MVWARDSVFPLATRYTLPHFYLNAGDGWWVVRYLEYLPNLIWLAASDPARRDWPALEHRRTTTHAFASGSAVS